MGTDGCERQTFDGALGIDVDGVCWCVLLTFVYVHTGDNTVEGICPGSSEASERREVEGSDSDGRDQKLPLQSSW